MQPDFAKEYSSLLQFFVQPFGIVIVIVKMIEEVKVQDLPREHSRSLLDFLEPWMPYV